MSSKNHVLVGYQVPIMTATVNCEKFGEVHCLNAYLLHNHVVDNITRPILVGFPSWLSISNHVLFHCSLLTQIISKSYTLSRGNVNNVVSKTVLTLVTIVINF